MPDHIAEAAASRVIGSMTLPHLYGDVKQHKQRSACTTDQDHFNAPEPGVAGLKLQLNLAVSSPHKLPHACVSRAAVSSMACHESSSFLSKRCQELQAK
jgi:hypothetical protein